MLNAEQTKAFELMKSGANVHLYGEAGTGKSYVTKAFLNSLTSDERARTLITAPTGIAALNIGGVTLHRTFAAPTEPISPDNIPPPKSLENVQNADRIIIDEISMCRFDLFTYIIKCIQMSEKKANKKIQIIVIGDFLQLPPVITDTDRIILNELWKTNDVGAGYAFESPCWSECNFVNVGLKTVVRQQEKALAEAENKARKGDISCIDWFLNNTSKSPLKNAITIVSTKREAKHINDRAVKSLKNSRIFVAEKTGDADKNEKPTDDNLKICENMRVMLIVNDAEGGISNGEMGTVEKILDNTVMVRFDCGVFTRIEAYTFSFFTYEVKEDKKKRKYVEKTVTGTFRQLPLRPAYAITIHKSQGQTYDSVNVHAGSCFAAGQLYVALSRCKSASKMYIKNLTEKALIKASKALEFYENLDKQQHKQKIPSLPAKQPIVVKAVKTKKENWGGVRKGAGAKPRYKCKTVAIRVPVDSLERINKIIKEYLI